MDPIQRLLKTIRGVSKANPVTYMQLSEIIRTLWFDQGKITSIVNIDIENNTTNIYQSISNIIRTNQDNNHQSFLIENTTNASETVVSSWSVIPYNEQVGEFKAVVMVRNKANDTIITLMSLLSFDYSDAVDVVLQSDLITDSGLILTVGVNGSNRLYATVSGMPTDNKRIHLCFERCVMSERGVLLEAAAQFNMNMVAALSVYRSLSANFALSLEMSAELSNEGENGGTLTLVWDNIYHVPVSDAASVSDWNTLFNLPTLGTPFTSVVVDGNTILLDGGANITTKTDLFKNNIYLVSVDDPSGNIVAIGNSSFHACTNLVSVNTPFITTIGNSSFYNCYNLAFIDMPLVTVIGYAAFVSCSSIIEFHFPLVTILEYLNYEKFTGSFIDCDETFGGCSSATRIHLPLVTETHYGTFGGCSSCTSFEMDNLQHIGKASFSGCAGATIFDFPALLSIGEQGFSQCSNAITFDFPLLETIGSGCFYECSSVIEFNFPLLETITSENTSGSYAFGFCTSATTFNFPVLTSIKSTYTFRACTSMASFYAPLCIEYGDINFNGGWAYTFAEIIGKTIALTISASYVINDWGGYYEVVDEYDLEDLINSNTCTIIQI